MRNFFLIFLLIPFLAFSQVCDSIKMNSIEFPSIVVPINTKSNSEIYAKVKSWINRNYKNPEFVTKADEANNYIKLSGSSNFSFKLMGTQTYDYLYTIEIDFKPEKYKVTFSNISFYNTKVPDYFYNNGELRKNSNYQKIRQSLMNDLNRIHFDIYNFIKSEPDKW